MNQAPPVRPATDVVAGRYALCDPIDSGGSGTVWRAWDLARKRYCAAKLLRRRDAGQLLRFVREQAVRLEGDHIASPYAWAAEDADVLIATELVDGGSLHALVLDNGPLAEPTVAVLLDQLLTGLHQVHTAGLIHRDVKPGNVLLRATGTAPLYALLTDFGIAIRSDDARLTELGMVVGTPGYLPPEIAQVGSAPSVAQDLFAAGRTASAVLAAREPTLGVLQDVSVADPVLGQVLSRLVDRDPAARPDSAAAARAMLAGARLNPIPITREGVPVVIRPRLPALPDGWDPLYGPSSTARMTPARDAVDHRPRRATIVENGVILPPPQVRPVTAPRPPSRWPLFVGGLGIALALAAIVTAVVVGKNPRSPGQQAKTGEPESNQTPVDATVSGQSAMVSGPAIGDDCSWLQEGDSSAGAAGTVVCTLTADGRYHWGAP